jgi:tetratricopeptide (TPR) repeat protein
MKLANTNDKERATDRSDPDDAALYSAESLAEIVGVSPEQWVGQQLLEPTQTRGRGEFYFDFRQASAAQTLRELAESGADLKKLRRGMKRLRRWLPPQRAAAVPILPPDGRVQVRLGEGELAEADGQLCFEFDDGGSPLPLGTTPRTAAGWFDLGASHEADGDLDPAITAYTQALRTAGPDARICFALAHALAEAGKHEQAAERYLQVIEIEPQDGDAWNNLGTVLCAMDLREQACDAFAQAIEVDPHNARARFNLADTLDELGRIAEAALHFGEYLRFDPGSPWAAHARQRLTAI